MAMEQPVDALEGRCRPIVKGLDRSEDISSPWEKLSQKRRALRRVLYHRWRRHLITAEDLNKRPMEIGQAQTLLVATWSGERPGPHRSWPTNHTSRRLPFYRVENARHLAFQSDQQLDGLRAHNLSGFHAPYGHVGASDRKQASQIHVHVPAPDNGPGRVAHIP